MTSALISCIVPVYNGERYLTEALNSILAQTYRPIEIIIADDGSTDGTRSIAIAYAADARYVWQTNGGPAAARNLGLCNARGEFVAFLDADDLWQPTKLELQMARFAAQPELEVSLTFVQNFRSAAPAQNAGNPPDRVFSKPLPGYIAQTMLARKSVFDVVGFFDPALIHADKTEWFLRAAEKQAVIELLPDVMVYRRLHETNISRTFGEESRQEYLRLLKAKIDRQRQQRSS